MGERRTRGTRAFPGRRMAQWAVIRGRSPRRMAWWILPLVAGVPAWFAATASPESPRPSPPAEVKANELLAAFARAGLPPPSTVDRLATVLGGDGGVVCEAAARPDHLASLGKQPSPLPVSHLFQSLVLVVKTYCPDRLPPLELLAGGTAVTPV